MNKKYLKHFITCAGAIAAIFSSSMLIADSAITTYATNGHKYQLISKQLNWMQASDYCKKTTAPKGGYLATITSRSENDFVGGISGVLGGATWVGGGNTLNGGWQWLTTQEQFSYSNWASGQPTVINGNNIILTSNGWAVDNSQKAWYFLCEWGNNTIYTSVLGLPDLNNNGSPESAVLYHDTNKLTHTVVIKDTDTKATLNTIVFDTKNAIPPIAMTQISDMNGNGVPEIAVMYWTKKSGAIGPMIGLMIKDAFTGIASRSTPIAILSNQYTAISLTITPDITGDGIDELEVLVQQNNNGAVSSQIIDPVAGTVIKTIKF